MLAELEPKTLKGVLPQGLRLDTLSSEKISRVACGSGARSDLELSSLEAQLFYIEGWRSFSPNRRLTPQNVTLRSLWTRTLPFCPPL